MSQESGAGVAEGGGANVGAGAVEAGIVGVRLGKAVGASNVAVGRLDISVSFATAVPPVERVCSTATVWAADV